jgi:uncharacterized membrane protein YGL010W
MTPRPIEALFDEYGESHRNPVNVTVHWIAVPLIFFSVVGLLASIPAIQVPYLGRLAVVVLALAGIFIFYMRHSLVLAVGMLVFASLCLGGARWLEAHAPWPLWAICLAVFVVAWIAQFIGHGVEGKKPSFLRDLLVLLVGPAWLLAKLYRKLGVTY